MGCGGWVRNMYDDLLRLTPTFYDESGWVAPTFVMNMFEITLPYVMNMFEPLLPYVMRKKTGKRGRLVLDFYPDAYKYEALAVGYVRG